MEVIIRKAKPSDKDFVLEFTKNTWDWGDYIHLVWDHWITDPYGSLFVAEVGGKPIGIIHIRYMPDKSVWMEGLRIHPDYRRKGIAKKLNEEVIGYCREKGFSVFRGAIFEWNKPSLLLATKKLGFRILEPRWIVIRGDIEKLESKGNGDLKEINHRAFLEMVKEAPLYKITKGLVFYRWAWFKLSEDSLKEVLKRDRDKEMRFLSCDGTPIMIGTRSDSRYVVEINIFNVSNGIPKCLEKAIKTTFNIEEKVEEARYMIAIPETNEASKTLSGLIAKEVDRIYIFEKVF